MAARTLGRFVVIVLCLVGGAAIALWLTSAFPNLSPFTSTAAESDSQVINAVNRTEEVALVSLGIQGIRENRSDSELFGVRVPGSDRVSFIQYSFNAKLGLDGEDVLVEQTDETTYVVSIPEFIFIGHDEINFATAVEDNGVLSWATENIDPLDVVNDVLDDEAQSQYLEAQRPVLEEQAETFYKSLMLSVDPEIEIDFEFAD